MTEPNMGWGVVIHSHQGQRDQLSGVLSSMGLDVHAFQSAQEIDQWVAPLGSLWVIFDSEESDVGQSTIASSLCQRLRAIPQSAFWGILIVGQRASSARQPLIQAGADAYLAYPFDRAGLVEQFRTLIDQRMPVSAYNVLPAHLATAIDKLSLKIDQLSYYEILEVDPNVKTDELQSRFHQRSLLLHPDRHREMKRTYPQVFNRVNQLYKTLLEAYRVLCDPLQHLMYSTMLSRGSLRWDASAVRQLRSILSISNDEEVQKYLVSSYNARSRGQLYEAHHHIYQSLQLEPKNLKVRALEEHYRSLINLVRRDPALQQQLPAPLPEVLALNEGVERSSV